MPFRYVTGKRVRREPPVSFAMLQASEFRCRRPDTHHNSHIYIRRVTGARRMRERRECPCLFAMLQASEFGGSAHAFCDVTGERCSMQTTRCTSRQPYILTASDGSEVYAQKARATRVFCDVTGERVSMQTTRCTARQPYIHTASDGSEVYARKARATYSSEKTSAKD